MAASQVREVTLKKETDGVAHMHDDIHQSFHQPSTHPQHNTKARELLRLLRLPSNRACADCDAPLSDPGRVWAGVSHGVFLCTNCASVHRKVGRGCVVLVGCGCGWRGWMDG